MYPGECVSWPALCALSVNLELHTSYLCYCLGLPYRDNGITAHRVVAPTIGDRRNLWDELAASNLPHIGAGHEFPDTTSAEKYPQPSAVLLGLLGGVPKHSPVGVYLNTIHLRRAKFPNLRKENNI